MRGDRTTGQGPGKAGGEHVATAPQQLQYVVEQITGTRASFAQVFFSQQTKRFTVHLEQIGVEPRQVELYFGPLHKRGHVFFGPNSRVGDWKSRKYEIRTSY